MKRLVIAATVSTLLVGVGVGSANAGATKGGSAGLACVVYDSSGNADTSSPMCVVSAGTAKINTDADHAALVYQSTNAVASATLSSLTQLGFSYSGTLTPRLNLNVNQDDYNNKVYDYVFIEGGTCNDGLGNVKPLANPVCSIVYAPNVTGVEGHDTTSTTYPSWAAFITANPTLALVDNNSNQPYVIQDTPGLGTVSNVQLGKPSISGKKK